MKILVPLICFFALLNAAIIPPPISEDSEEGNVVGGSDNAGEYGDHFQGDIVLTPEQEKEFSGEGRNGRTGIINTKARWPKTNGLVYVPYVLSSSFSSSEVSKIKTALNDIASKTCVRFVARTSQADYVNVISGSGCYSYIGRIGGKQDLSLQRPNCVYHGTIMHEFIHALGYDHAQNDVNRDTLVTINWGNITPGKEHNFNKVSSSQYSSFGTAYDLDSVMHYGSKSFSKNNGYTITAKSSSNQGRIGQRERLSSGDVTRIKNMYQC